MISCLNRNEHSYSEKKVSSIETEETNINADEVLENVAYQLELLVKVAETKNAIPRTIDKEGEIHWANPNFDWTEGFFSGSLWYLYKVTNEEKWKSAAEKFQTLFERHKYFTSNHDLGFIFNTSFANGYELTKNNEFMDVMSVAADSLITRFNPNVGCIKSWDTDKGWQSKRDWKFPVIIDNMMNLELLFKVSHLTKNKKYREIAIKHANTTLKNHFRDDNSSYHVVDYDSETGEVRSKQTAQGFSNESAWARGQAWGVYGYTVCYRYTKDSRYLKQAERIAKFILDNNHKNKDKLPFWDYNASQIPNEPVDVSAAAITASALIELDGYTSTSYRHYIDEILNTLASDKYTAKIGQNQNFVLMHSVGSIPHGNEIDVPLNYADYYYIEALVRYKNTYLK
ncbi:glycoside hydrolase family 88 protein [Aquimarina aggregata]|uniref:glycoside hydrolase family 88 protein n=1 Tax=Aquimarina aggregata TaxID=1642818 RepID=UPI0024935EF5|nr:glycoside hydrolase family 88 protein [Aquimarina aggregata]